MKRLSILESRARKLQNILCTQLLWWCACALWNMLIASVWVSECLRNFEFSESFLVFDMGFQIKFSTKIDELQTKTVWPHTHTHTQVFTRNCSMLIRRWFDDFHSLLTDFHSCTWFFTPIFHTILWSMSNMFPYASLDQIKNKIHSSNWSAYFGTSYLIAMTRKPHKYITPYTWMLEKYFADEFSH